MKPPVREFFRTMQGLIETKMRKAASHILHIMPTAKRCWAHAKIMITNPKAFLPFFYTIKCRDSLHQTAFGDQNRNRGWATAKGGAVRNASRRRPGSKLGASSVKEDGTCGARELRAQLRRLGA